MNFVAFGLILTTCFYVLVDAMYNGEYRSVKDYPYMVQLYFFFNSTGSISYCGAAILSNYWVITAAHCVGSYGATIHQVRIESSATLENGILIDVDKIFAHGDVSPDFAWDNDIALIKLKTPIEFNEYQQPIRITKQSPKVGDNITVLGFGDHHHGVSGMSLRVAQTSVIDDECCLKSYELQYSKNMICTSVKSIDLCFGDSGGPAVYNGKLIGINSQGCSYTIPNVLTKVANYYDWILQLTGIQYIN